MNIRILQNARFGYQDHVPECLHILSLPGVITSTVHAISLSICQKMCCSSVFILQGSRDSTVDIVFIFQFLFHKDVFSHVERTTNHTEWDQESRKDVPTPLCPNVEPDFAHHHGDEVSGVPRTCSGGGKIQLTVGRESGDLGAVAPSQGFPSICKWMTPVFLLGSYGCIFHGTGNSAQLCRNFGFSRGVGFEHPLPPYATGWGVALS
jgi:hypothetical protein